MHAGQKEVGEAGQDVGPGHFSMYYFHSGGPTHDGGRAGGHAGRAKESRGRLGKMSSRVIWRGGVGDKLGKMSSRVISLM
jgi:hypothetical protein